MSVSFQMHAVQVLIVKTLSDHTDVNAQWDILQTQSHRIQWIQCAMVRNLTYSLHDFKSLFLN